MPSILHIGIGNFHRAHQAWYTKNANALGGEQWRITGTSLRSAKIRDALAPQNFAYTLAIKDASGSENVQMAEHDCIFVGNEDQSEIIAFIADVDTSVVTLTVSEKGYHLDPATGCLNLAASEIAEELERGTPATAMGFIAHGLKARADTHGQPINIISCDNLPENGRKLQAAIQQFCSSSGFVLDDYLATKVAFPNSMVDRIVPATTDALRTEVHASTGFEDAHPVATEAFSEWYLEDKFTAPIPAWGGAGVRIVEDVRPFELRKLRMLNGAHSFLAYAGLNAGYRRVHEAIADPDLCQAAIELMIEASETLPDESRCDADDYAKALIRRFKNPHLNHELSQIAMDGSLKLPVRILPVIANRRALGLTSPAEEKALRAWSKYAVDRLRHMKKLDDPEQNNFSKMEAGIRQDSALADALLKSIGAA